MGNRRRRRGRRSWGQRLLIAFNSLLALACLAAAGAFHVARAKAAEVPVYHIDSIANARISDTEVRNILMVGTDDSSGLDDDDPTKKGRGSEHLADTIMILRVDPVAKTAAILSIPRDTWVPVAPNWSSTKINGALNRTEGPKQLIATIRHSFGISIDNYVEVDLGGFKEVYRALGGIRVYNKYPIKDPKTSLWLPETGCITLDPEQALAYARTRDLWWQDSDTYTKGGKWKHDTTVDYGRIARQQDLIKQTAQSAIERGIRNPITAYKLVNAAIGSVTTDDTINADWVVDLIQTFREFPVDQLATHRLPTSSTNKGGASAESVQWDEAADLLRFFRGVPAEGEVRASDVIVSVPDSFEAADGLVSALDGAGFDATAESAKAFNGSTTAKKDTIRYGADGAEAAAVLAAHLDLDPAREIEFVLDEDLPGRRLEFIPRLNSEPSLRPEPLPTDMVRQAAEIVVPTTTTTTTTMRTSQAGNHPSTTDASATTTSVAETVVGNTTTTSSLDQDESEPATVGMIPFDAAMAASCR
ncbi:MAG: LCP family protein [Microthrixaceae bacterium]|nr:LCP family protein [Microthrixaceae bacterium]